MRQFKWWQIGIITTLLLGALMMTGCTSAPLAKSGDTVKVDYTLTLDDGTVYDTSVGKTPFEFTLGQNTVLPGFENAIIGMKVGQTKSVKIKAADAYGTYDSSLVTVYDRSTLPTSITPAVGMQLTATNKDGTTQVVTITAFDDKTVTIDANPPLAGKNLNFKITLIEIVPPSEVTTTATTTAAPTTTDTTASTATTTTTDTTTTTAGTTP